jgi:hypothetical protein
LLKDSKQELIENLFNFIDEEIEIRIESLKIAVDFASEQKFEELANYEMTAIKKSAKLSIKNLTKKRKQKILKILIKKSKVINMKQSELVNLVEKTDTFMYNFEFIYTNELKISKENAATLIWLRTFDIDILRKNTRKAKLQPLVKTDKKETLKSLCSLNDEFILFVSYNTDQLIVFNSDFILEKSYKFIEDAELDRPYSICTNDVHSIIYLVNFGKQELILVDKSLNTYRKRITRDDFGFHFYPVDCTFFKQSIYLLERSMSRVIKLSEYGDFQNEYQLYQSNEKTDLLIWPLKIQVCPSVMAILEDKKLIYIYDLNANLKQIINENSSMSNKIETDIQSFIIVDNYLIFHSSNGTLSVFIEEKGIFKFLFKRKILKLFGAKSHMCVFNGQLFIIFEENDQIKHGIMII